MKSFGPFRLDTSNLCLWRADERAVLTPKAFDILRYLVDHAGRLVTHDELLNALWPETHVNPEGIRKYIAEIRRVLGDRSAQPEFIATIPKRGYHFVASITEQRREEPIAARREKATIVGRDEVLTQLGSHLERASAGMRQIVFVTGEAGVGKTTLVDAFQQRLAGNSKLRIARGQCIEGFGGCEAYYPVLEALGSLLRNADNSLIQILAERAPTWLIQFPALVTPEQRHSLQREILGSTRQRMVREICEALELITLQTPLIMILEDLHWVDPATLDLVSAVARRRESARLLLLATYRPADVVVAQSPLKNLKQDLLIRKLCQEIPIDCLQESDVADYLATIFKTESIPSGFSKMIHQNSGGNALFMVTMVNDMLNKGLIAENHGSLVLTTPADQIRPGIPETLQQMLEIQLEQLNKDEQRILQSGSVVGEQFSVWAIAPMTESSPALIEEMCDRLAKSQQFIRSIGMREAPDGTRSAHYEFRHSLYRRALYSSLSGLNRAELHRTLSERLVTATSEKPEFASELALHLEEGRDYERAVGFLMLAAENAVKRFAHRQSIHILRHAHELVAVLALDARLDREIQILQRIGDAHYTLGEMSDAAVLYEAAADHAARAGLTSARVGALLRLAAPAWFADSLRGDRVCQLALEVSEALDDPLLAARTRLAVGCFRLIYRSWLKEDSDGCVLAQETIRRATGSSIAQNPYYIYVQTFRGEYSEAHKQADSIIATATDPRIYLLASAAKGVIFLFSGRFGELLQMIRTERASAEKNGEDPWMWVFGDAWLRTVCFDFEGACRVCDCNMRNDSLPHTAWTRTVSRIAQGYSDLYGGNYRNALHCFAQVRDLNITPKFFLHWHWRMQAELGTIEAWLSAGEIKRARREAHGFLQSALFSADPNMHVRAWEMMSRVSTAEQDGDSARTYIEKALLILDNFQIPVSAWHVHRAASDLYQCEGEYELADVHRTRAKQLIMRLADSFDDNEPLKRSFLTAPPVRWALEETARSYKNMFARSRVS